MFQSKSVVAATLIISEAPLKLRDNETCVYLQLTKKEMINGSFVKYRLALRLENRNGAVLLTMFFGNATFNIERQIFFFFLTETVSFIDKKGWPKPNQVLQFPASVFTNL